MAHDVNLPLSLLSTLSATASCLGRFILILLCEDNTEVHTLINKCSLNELQSLVHFLDGCSLILTEELSVEERQVQVFLLRRLVFGQRVFESFRDHLEE